MSIATWKKEFYSPISKVSKKNAVQHSLTKWIGLRPENIEKHDLEINLYSEVYDPESMREFGINDTSCALCKWHQYSNEGCCETCPFVVHLGRTCDKDEHSPFFAWEENHDPEPMIKDLTQLLILQRHEEELK